MGKLIKFQVADLPDVLLVGKEIRHSMEEQMKGNNPIPAFWDRCFAEDIFSVFQKQAYSIFKSDYVGVMTDWDKGDGDFSYIIGMLMKPGADVPEGYVSHVIKATKVAIGWIQGKDVADVCMNAHELTEKALEDKGHSCEKMTWSMELYNCPRFTSPDENGQIILDYYIPIDK
ncbi:MAG: GyrI-like domain-containing protein [Oscillospiraceae bacterium]|nr:GyrI-like domain-containing protein [Oscillospiraceae bacterium]